MHDLPFRLHYEKKTTPVLIINKVYLFYVWFCLNSGADLEREYFLNFACLQTNINLER